MHVTRPSLLLFAVPLLVAPISSQTTVRVNVTGAGLEVPTGGSGFPDLSADGRFVLFTSNDPALTGVAGAPFQVFVRDRDPDENGLLDEGNGQTVLVTRAANGALANGSCHSAAISDDGRWIAFTTSATNLSPHIGLPGAGISYLVDRDPDQNGVFDELPNAYHAMRGPGDVAPNAVLGGFDVAGAGAFVAFESSASNLVANDANGTSDVFRWERATGAIVRASVSSTGAQGDAISRRASISDDGNRIAFDTNATNLGGDVLVRDVSAGTTTRVSVSSTGVPGNSLSLKPDISGDGTAVAFDSYASNFDPIDTDLLPDVYVHDLTTGETELVSVDSFGVKANTGGSTDPKISSDATRVCFASLSTNLWWNDQFAARDVFLHDRVEGWTRMATVATDGQHANDVTGELIPPFLSADGNHVSFHTRATNLVPNDTNGSFDLFVRSFCGEQGTELGFTLPGTTGLTPELLACDEPGTPAVLRLVHAPAGRPGAFFWSPAQGNVPFAGGTLVPGTPSGLVRFVTDATGKSTTTLPAAAGPGAVFVHGVVRDPGLAGGAAFSNAVALTVLP